MRTLVRKIKARAFIIAVLLFFTMATLGCSKNKTDNTLEVHPVFNNRAANSYIAANGGEAAVIDPTDTDRIISILTQKGLTLKVIILTHGHFDHILGLDSLVKRYPGTKVLIHPLDNEKLSDPEKNVSLLFGTEFKSSVKSYPVTGKDIIKIGNTEFRVIETPGHTQGSIILLSGNCLFSGDTLFKDSVGRTDFPESSSDQLSESLKRIGALSGDLTIYPGHGDVTSLRQEKETNPYMQ